MRDVLEQLGAWTARASGANSTNAGFTTQFRVWAPEEQSVEVVLERRSSRDEREIRSLTRGERGYWSAVFDDSVPGDKYRYRLGGDDRRVYPDPASRYQPQGVHGPSEIIDTDAFLWTDGEWHSPRLQDLVIYELHVGTFSAQGTFRGAAERLPYLAQLGVSAIELMPVADFPGTRNWGYDGVALFAPSRAYGRPEDLQALVNAAHQHGIAVLLDVVYNHLGPDGAYANAFSPYYFTNRHKSPWGQGVNLDGPHSHEVRSFFVANALHWIHAYHIDGLRLDATHALPDDSPTHFLRELTETVRVSSRKPVLMIAEDHRNLTKLLLGPNRGGYDLDAVWADDFHHQVRVHVARDCEGYYQDYNGSSEDIARTIQRGWFFTGQRSAYHGHPRGTDPTEIDPRRFVVCIQNHDQIGNRADGARLNHQVDAATFRAISTLLLALPETPLLFQGQEWATTAPFLFFTDHEEDLGRRVTFGRREEFASFAAFADVRMREAIPDPQAPDTFERSRLPWQEVRDPRHASMLRLYQRVLGLRATAAALRSSDRDSFDVRALDEETILLEQRNGEDRLCVIVRLAGEGAVTIRGIGPIRTLLTTEDVDLAVDPVPVDISSIGDHVHIRFARPGAVIVQSL
jgi:maltooligosyltrehalose trehalohydrolase